MTKVVLPFIRFIHTILHNLLGSGINGAGGLIQNQHRRIRDSRPGNSQKLPLSLAQVRPITGKDGVISVRQTADKSVGIGQLRCRPHFLIRSVQFTVTDILRHGSRKQVGILQHNAQRMPQIRFF